MALGEEWWKRKGCGRKRAWKGRGGKGVEEVGRGGEGKSEGRGGRDRNGRVEFRRGALDSHAKEGFLVYLFLSHWFERC